MGLHHQESPQRITSIRNALDKSDLKINYIEANPASDEEILKVHSEDLLAFMRRSTGNAKMKVTNDTSTNMFTFDAATAAAGGAIQMASNLSTHHGFSMLRPPGHHATENAAMGFCFFNNIAIATRSIQEQYDRIVILDVDNHHGNGTSRIFANDPNVLYISLHADPEESYPGTGYADALGSKEGLGKTVNLPLPWKIDDANYLVALDEVVVPILEQFKPNLFLVSLGFDGLKSDPYGSLGLSPDGFYEIGRRIGDLNSRLTSKKVGSVLEGGYDLMEIGNAAVAFFEGLMDPSGPEKVKPKLSHKFEYNLRRIKAIQRNHWFGI